MFQPTSNAWQSHQAPTNQSNQPAGKKNDIELLKERMKQLEAILSNSSPIIGFNSVANSGKQFILDKIFTIVSKKSLIHVEPRNSWILDSGSTDHITPITDFFTSYVPRSMNKKVQTADGRLLTISGIGTITLDPIGKLEHVLHVPQLFLSLLFVQKIRSIHP